MTAPPPRLLRWSFLGRQAYAPIAELQEELRRAIRAGQGPEHLLLLEHSPVYTLGRNADPNEVLVGRAWLAQHGVELHESNRGGKVTYHGPGQLVGYPILDLNPDRRDVRRYVRDLQEVLIRVLASYGIIARRGEDQDHIGVWVEDEKIASLGVHLARWITIHGFALNVATELSFFHNIVACGLPAVRMTSIERLTGQRPELAEVAGRTAIHLAEVFGRRLVAVDATTILGERSAHHLVEAP